jgi:perosamine synthetase
MSRIADGLTAGLGSAEGHAFREVPSGGPWITEKEAQYVADATANGWYENWHNYLDCFENGMCAYTNTKFALSTSSCTGALHIAMAALGIKPGDEVVVPETTWIATVSCVCYLGGTPVFVDVEPDTWCMDPEAFRRAITSRTKAVIPVHMFGHPADMDSINEIAAGHGVAVIEDAAPGIGSRYNERPAGSLGLAGAFSFQGAKPLVTGEGGCLVTNDENFYDRAYFYWDHGRDKTKILYNSGIGFKYKMSNIQAALGFAQLERADEIISKRRQIFYWYKEGLSDIEGLRLNIERPGVFNNFYVPTIVLDGPFKNSAEEVMAIMNSHGVRNRPFFRCMSKFPMFSPAQTPVADHLAAHGINLPCATKLTHEDVMFAVSIVRKALLG